MLISSHKISFQVRFSYLFISIFFSLLAVKVLFDSFDPLLHDINKIIPAIATFDQVDVSARVAVFYQSVFLFLFTFLLSTLLLSVIYDKSGRKKILLNDWNNLCFLSSLFIIYELFESPMEDSLTLISFIFISLLLFQILKYKVALRFFKIKHLLTYTWALGSALSFVIVRFLSAKGFNIPHFHLIIIISVLLLFALFIVFSKIKQLKFRTVYLFFLPFFFIPFLFVFSSEFYLILNQHDIHILSPNIIFFGFLLLLFFMGLWLSFSKKIPFNINRTNVAFVYPLVTLGILLYVYYNPFVDQPKEMFELANPANGVMRLLKFNEWPTFEALSSHLLSDIGFPLLYTFMNGYNSSLDFILYDFLPIVLYTLLFFYFLRKYVDQRIVICIIFFFPAIFSLIRGSHAWVFVSIFLLSKLFESFTIRRIIFLCFWCLFLVIWKLDLAYSAIVATTSVVILHFIDKFDKSKLLKLLKISIIFCISTIMLISLIALVRKVPLVENLKSALDYFSANQAHGFSTITASKNEAYYSFYYLFPFATIGMFMYLFINRKNYTSIIEKSLYFALCFLIIYYFANAQRGLVRHSLAEGGSGFIINFFYLILSLFMLLKFWHNSYKYFIFILSFFIPVLIFSQGNIVGGTSIYEELSKKIRSNVNLHAYNHKVIRIIGKESFEMENTNDLKHFMDKNFPASSTFLDFSNTPMLYFYCQKLVPSYFNQYMQNTVSESLQKSNLEYIKKFDIPLVVFSNKPRNWYDATDEVPNTLRYELITRHIYQNYFPFSTIGKHFVWLRNDLKQKFPAIDSLDFYWIHKAEVFNLKLYCGLLALKPSIMKDTIQVQSWSGVAEKYVINSLVLRSFNDKLFLHLNSDISQFNCVLKFYHNDTELGSINFKTKQDFDHTGYLIPIGLQYNWSSMPITHFTILREDGQKLSISSIILLKK